MPASLPHFVTPVPAGRNWAGGRVGGRAGGPPGTSFRLLRVSAAFMSSRAPRVSASSPCPGARAGRSWEGQRSAVGGGGGVWRARRSHESGGGAGRGAAGVDAERGGGGRGLDPGGGDGQGRPLHAPRRPHRRLRPRGAPSESPVRVARPSHWSPRAGGGMAVSRRGRWRSRRSTAGAIPPPPHPPPASGPQVAPWRAP